MSIIASVLLFFVPLFLFVLLAYVAWKGLEPRSALQGRVSDLIRKNENANHRIAELEADLTYLQDECSGWKERALRVQPGQEEANQ